MVFVPNRSFQRKSWTIAEVPEKAEKRQLTCESWSELKKLADCGCPDDIELMDIKLDGLDSQCHENLAFSFLRYKAKFNSHKDFMPLYHEFKSVGDLQVFRMEQAQFTGHDYQKFSESRFIYGSNKKKEELCLYVAPVIKEPFTFSSTDGNGKRRKVAFHSFVEIANFIQEEKTRGKRINTMVLNNLGAFILHFSTTTTTNK